MKMPESRLVRKHSILDPVSGKMYKDNAFKRSNWEPAYTKRVMGKSVVKMSNETNYERTIYPSLWKYPTNT